MVCKRCGGRVLYGDLHCSPACRKADMESAESVRQAMITRGFEPDALDPHILRKYGVAITLGKVLHVGLDRSIEEHAAAVEARKAR